MVLGLGLVGFLAGVFGSAGDSQEQVQADQNESAINSQKLTTILGDDLAASLMEMAKINDDAYWIASHPDAYAFNGEHTQYKLLQLAATEPEALTYVRQLPDAYPASVGEPTTDFPQGEIPQFYQWDLRWGYTSYSGAPFGITGCCPTSFAMVYQGLTGKKDLTPYDMGVKAQEGGYMTVQSGTDSNFVVNTALDLGLQCEEIYATPSSMRSALKDGDVIMVNLGPGDFTDDGHYIVVYDINDEGQAVVNDPFSVQRSSRLWDVDAIASQAISMYTFHRS